MFPINEVHTRPQPSAQGTFLSFKSRTDESIKTKLGGRMDSPFPQFPSSASPGNSQLFFFEHIALLRRALPKPKTGSSQARHEQYTPASRDLSGMTHHVMSRECFAPSDDGRLLHNHVTHSRDAHVTGHVTKWRVLLT